MPNTPRRRGGAPHGRSAGACDVAEDPRLDAREACPQWRASTDALLHVRASRTPDAVGRFDLWRVPGRKRLALSEDGLVLHTEPRGSRVRLLLDARLADGAGYFCGVPLTAGLRDRLGDFQAQMKILAGHAPNRAPARRAGRGALLHLRALQALDAVQAGASQRGVAQALFGLEAVARRWQDDGELRAQVRHLLRRAAAHMAGGYLALAGIRQLGETPPGDEAPR